MELLHTLEETLVARFEGERDEMMDIMNHGISGGFNGFIYTYEINEFFNEFEDEIEDYFYEMFGDSWLVDSGAADKVTMNEVRCHLVWGLVEIWCGMTLDELEEEMLEEMREDDEPSLSAAERNPSMI